MALGNQVQEGGVIQVFQQSTFDRWPLADKSVQAIITSPPYWGLRKYDIPDVVIGGRQDCRHEFVETIIPTGNGDSRGNRRDRKAGIKRGLRQPGFCRCGAWKGQYGLEPSYRDYIAHTMLWIEEAWRVLKDDGMFFLNVGDTYATGKGGCRNPGGGERSQRQNMSDLRKDELRVKTKIGIPHRIAIAMVDGGWRWRNDIIWHKPNSIPESVVDRFSKKYENIFLFTKRPKVFFNIDAVREPQQSLGKHAAILSQKGPKHIERAKEWNTPIMNSGVRTLNPKGKNPGDVWSIPAQPSPEAHYAMWPEKLVERMVLCSTRPGDVVLDPFAGSGTTLRVADRLGREAYGIDLGYQEIQKRRLGRIQKELCL